MSLIPVSSSAISAVGYDPFFGILTVRFRNGRVYDHPDVPWWVYVELMEASSMGAYYNRCIRGRYR